MLNGQSSVLIPGLKPAPPGHAYYITVFIILLHRLSDDTQTRPRLHRLVFDCPRRGAQLRLALHSRSICRVGHSFQGIPRLPDHATFDVIGSHRIFSRQGCDFLHQNIWPSSSFKSIRLFASPVIAKRPNHSTSPIAKPALKPFQSDRPGHRVE